MFSQNEPNVKATIAFLKLLNVRVNAATVNETLQNHPNWPSVLCVSDSLCKWNIPNGSGKIESAQIDLLPVPFMACMNDRNNPLAVVKDVTDETVKVCNKTYSKAVMVVKEEFIKSWTGIYLIAEPNKLSGEKDYVKNKCKAVSRTLVSMSLFSLLIILSFVSVYKLVNKYDSGIATAVYFQYFSLLAGITVSSALLWYEIDGSNSVLQKVCTAIAKGNCQAILTGKKSKVFSWLSWSEVGFFYFAGALLTLLVSGNSIYSCMSFLAWLNILALPYTVFSVYYQWQVAKQWCVLCLAIQALLISGGINIVVNTFLTFPPVYSIQFISKAFLLYLLPMLLWYAVKPYILNLREAKNTKREYLRVKFDAEIFETLLKKQKELTISPDGLGIDLGNPGATNTVIKVCNPYCGPCSKVHPKIEKLLEENSNVKVKIIFNTPNNENAHAIKPTRHLLALSEKNGNAAIIQKSLDDWYLPDEKNYELFAAKYPMNGELVKQDGKIEAMEKWCRAMDISYTPAIFVNGYELPNAYGIEDLQYFLLE